MYKDFLDQAPELEQQRAEAPRTSQEELADAQYRAVLNKSDDRILRASGGVLPPNPLAPKEPPIPGSEAEYELLLSKMDPRLLWKGR